MFARDSCLTCTLPLRVSSVEVLSTSDGLLLDILTPRRAFAGWIGVFIVTKAMCWLAQWGTPASGIEGSVGLGVGPSGAATADVINVTVVRPQAISMTLGDASLSAIACHGAPATPVGYQATRLQLRVDGLHMATPLGLGFVSSDTSVATVSADRVVGVAPGTATNGE